MFYKHEDEGSSSCIKLEPSPVDILQLSAPYPDEAIVIDDNSQTSGSSSFPRFDLPPLSIYYSSSHAPSSQVTPYTYPTTNHYSTQDAHPSDPHSFAASFSHTSQPDHEFPPSTHTPHTPHTSPSPAASSSNGLSSSHSSPSVTLALLARLPAPVTRSHLVQRARETHPQLALWVPWDQIMELADIGDKKREKEKIALKEKQKLAQSVFFGSRVDPMVSLSGNHQMQANSTSLPLFACFCYILALGALEKTAGRSRVEEDLSNTDSGFLYALAGQTMGVWEAHRYQVSDLEQDEDIGETDKTKTKDSLYHFIGCLLQVAFLFREGAGNGKQGIQAAFPLIGKLVNTARALGLAQDPDMDMPKGAKRFSKQSENEKEVRRMLWWETMFYDTFISDALKQPALTSTSSYSTRIPACASPPPPVVPSFSGPSSRKGQGNEEDEFEIGDGDADEEDSDEEGDNVPWNAASRGQGKGLRKYVSSSKGRGKGKDRVEVGGEGSKDEVFFGVRCRLTQLTQSIKHEFSHPGCECCGSGYTLDHAFKLESDIRTWISDLPQSLKLDSAPASGVKSNDAKANAVIAAELAVMANRLIIAAYVPFLKPSSMSSSSSHASRSWSPASRSTVDAAQGVISAGRVLHMLTRSNGAGNEMLMKEFYPLDKAFLDAVAICAHAGLGGGAKALKGKGVMEDVAIGLDVLTAMGGSVRGEMGKIVCALKTKVDGLSSEVADCAKADGNLLKRKHDQVEVTFEGSSHRQRESPVEASGLDEMLLDFDPSYEQNSNGMNEAVIPEPPAVPQSPVPQRVLPQQFLQRPHSRHPSPQRRESFSSRLKADKEKDKKHPKKGHNGYPTFGIRVRKELPPFAKRMEPTPPGSVSPNESSCTAPQPDTSLQPQSQVSAPQDEGYRSRSSSLTQTQDIRIRDPTQPIAFSLPFGGPSQVDLHVMTRNSFNLPEHQPQQSQQPFVSSPTTMYNPSQQPSRAGSFDHHRGFESHNSFDTTDSYIDSSPYNNSSAPLSAASSPYTSTSGAGPPPTPTFGPGPTLTSHHPSPPVFGQPSNTNSQGFYRIPGGYESTFDRHGQHPMTHGMAMDTSMCDQGAGAGGMLGSSDTSSAYEKSTHPMYDGKQGIELISPMQYQNPSQNAGHQHPLIDLSTAVPHSWNPMQPTTPSQTLGDQNGHQYWNSAMYY
ncbi:hypothetical protein BDZ94DRAFT_1259585, partial [Collybia nuda]